MFFPSRSAKAKKPGPGCTNYQGRQHAPPSCMLFRRNFPQDGTKGKGMRFQLERRYLSNKLNVGNDVSHPGTGNEYSFDLLFRLIPHFYRITTLAFHG